MVLDDAIQKDGQREKTIMEAVYQNIHVATPGKIISYNKGTRTAQIQPTIRNWRQPENPPILQDVPVFFMGEFIFDIYPGDDCVVIFGDACYDLWYQNGTVSSPITPRRHDLSDGFAFVGFRSKPKVAEIIPEELNLREELEKIWRRLDALEATAQSHEGRISALEARGE